MCVGRQLHSTSLLREVGVWADVCGEVVLATVAMREATAITVGKPSATSERLIIPGILLSNTFSLNRLTLPFYS
jgi:hypothetical protein